MAQRKQQPKFERNPLARKRDNYDTDGRRTNFDFMSSAELKMLKTSKILKEIKGVLRRDRYGTFYQACQGWH